MRPLVLVFEDLHWAEESLLELLEYLAMRATDVPILTLCVTRPELLERHPEWGGRVRNYAAVSLSPLSDGASRDLIEELLKGEAIPGDVLEGILEKAEGNPFFIEEILRMLIDGASLVRDERGWHWAPSSLEIRIPETINGLVASRIDLLTPLEKRVIQIASVSGRVFWAGALVASSELSAVEASAALDRLQERELVEERPTSSLIGEREFMFKHALTRDVAYRTLPKTLRSDSHTRFAQWLEVATASDDEFLEVLAHHYEHAWRYGFETGEKADGLAQKAIDILRKAGARATALRTLPEARRLYDRALAIFRKMDLRDEILMLELLTERDEVLKWGTVAEADSALLLKDTQTVLDRAPTLGREDLLARAWLNRAHAEYARWKLQQAEEALTKALKLFRRGGDRQGEAEALEILAVITEDLRGSLRSAQAAFHDALTLYRSMADGRGVARTTARLGRSLLLTGSLEAGRAALTEVLPLTQTYHERGFEATSLVGLSIYAHLTGDAEAAVRHLQEAIAIHQEQGSPTAEAQLRRRLAMTYLRYGKPDAAEEELQQIDALLGQQGKHPEKPSAVLRVLAELALAREDLYAAVEFAERAVATVAVYDTISVATHGATLAKVRGAQGRAAEAEELFQDSLKILEANDYRVDLALTWLKYGETLLALSRREQAREKLLHARGIFEEIGASFFVREVDRHLEAVIS
jgi:tetratricopeptide (TPR) repeat protein